MSISTFLMNLFCPSAIIFLSIVYIVSLGIVFEKDVFIFFEVEPVCSLPAGVACILSYIL